MFKWAQLQNSRYKIGMFLLLHYDTFFPMFGEITDIVVAERIIVFCVTIYDTKSFSTHFHSFVITPSISSDIVHIEDLSIHNPLSAHKSFNKADKNIYVSLPYMHL